MAPCPPNDRHLPPDAPILTQKWSGLRSPETYYKIVAFHILRLHRESNPAGAPTEVDAEDGMKMSWEALKITSDFRENPLEAKCLIIGLANLLLIHYLRRHDCLRVDVQHLYGGIVSTFWVHSSGEPGISARRSE